MAKTRRFLAKFIGNNSTDASIPYRFLTVVVRILFLRSRLLLSIHEIFAIREDMYTSVIIVIAMREQKIDLLFSFFSRLFAALL